MRFIFKLFAIVLLIGSTSLKAKSQTLDRLYERYYAIQKPTDFVQKKEKYELLGQIVDKEMFIRPEKVLQQIDTLADLAQIILGEKDYNRIRYRTKGFAYASAGRTLEALDLYKKYAKVFDKKGTDDGYFLIDIGNLYYRIGLLKIAKKTYQEAEKLFAEAAKQNEENALKGLGTIYGNYALIAKQQKQLDTAFYYSNKYSKLQEEIVKDTFQLALSHHTLGELYFIENKGREELSIYHFKKAIDYLDNDAAKEKRQYHQFIAFLPAMQAGLARVYSRQGKGKLANYYIDKSIENARRIKSGGAMIITHIVAADAYFEQGRYEEAKEAIDSIIAWATTRKMDTQLVEPLKLGIRIYSMQKNYEKAFEFTQRYLHIKNASQERSDELMIINELVLEKENEITIIQQEELIRKEQQLTNRLYYILFIVMLGTGVILFLLRQVRNKNKLIETYAEKIEKRDKTKEMMLSVIGHDLRSPFSIILGNASQLIKATQNNLNMASQIQQLYRSSKQAYVMMDGLLQWVALHKEEDPQVKNLMFSLQTSIATVIQDLDSSLMANQVKIHTHLPQNIELFSDALFFQIILRNILTNAVKHSNIDSIIKIIGKKEEERFILSIEDTGEGFEKEDLEYFRTDVSMLEVASQGHGLGLSIVQQLCQLLDIEIKAKNKKIGQGAIVELLIPIQKVTFSNVNKSNNNLEEIRTTSIYLDENEKLALQPFVQLLCQYEVFEGTAIHKIIHDIEQNKIATTIAMIDWLTRFKKVVKNNDDDAYQLILKEISYERN